MLFFTPWIKVRCTSCFLSVTNKKATRQTRPQRVVFLKCTRPSLTAPPGPACLHQQFAHKSRNTGLTSLHFLPMWPSMASGGPHTGVGKSRLIGGPRGNGHAGYGYYYSFITSKRLVQLCAHCAHPCVCLSENSTGVCWT